LFLTRPGHNAGDGKGDEHTGHTRPDGRGDHPRLRPKAVPSEIRDNEQGNGESGQQDEGGLGQEGAASLLHGGTPPSSAGRLHKGTKAGKDEQGGGADRGEKQDTREDKAVKRGVIRHGVDRPASA
jgi:hypothetical protein